ARAAIDLAVSASHVRLEVADDGGPARDRGPAGRQAGPGTGHGIVGMRERIGAFGGRLAAGPGADRGYRVIAEIPIEGAM
ncbi:MAG TPA: sensor histidine kinase, partial [Streptosporangiaceae bacterium]|nr:sensor histidine kinase [Streptosporangiaceae bacterium]